MTLNEFIKASSLNSKLVRSVVRQFGDWDYFTQCAPDITQHGAASGFNGFIYYTDTCAFYSGNRALIVAMVEQDADQCGMGSAEFVQSFRCIGKDYSMSEIGRTLYGTKSQHDTQIANALAWFALEEVARSFVDCTDNA